MAEQLFRGGIKGESMKKVLLFVLMCLVLATTPVVAAPYVPDAILELALEEIATGDQWHFCKDDGAGNPPDTYSEATTSGTFSLGYATVTPDTVPLNTAGCGSGDYNLADYDAGGGNTGRQLTLCSQADVDITLTANGDADFICVVDSGNTQLLGCIDITGAPETVNDFTSDTSSYDGTGAFRVRDIQ